MKIYSVDTNNQCVELVFKSEEDADIAFNSVISTSRDIGRITDMTGKIQEIKVSYGYSRDPNEILYVLEKELR